MDNNIIEKVEVCHVIKKKYEYKCIHGTKKYNCIKCQGSNVCIHDKLKQFCRECKGISYCIHDKLKQICRECKGSKFCIHDKRKQNCRDCGENNFCLHDKNKRECRECGGSRFCVHDKRKIDCRECDGSRFCIHDKRKPDCKICGGSRLCLSEFCHTTGSKHYNGYCLTCTVNLFPDMITKRNYKTKEKHVVDYITSQFPNLTLIADKLVENGCSKKRPDLLVDMGSHIIIIEIDEFQHKNYLCESKRTMEILQDVHFRNTIFIRFNPDEYIDESGKKIKSCWHHNKQGFITIVKSRENEWKSRLDLLVKTIQYHIDNESTKNLEIIKLFF